jgi:hypothetical protein
VSFSPEATNSYTILDDAVVEAFIPSHFFPSKRGASREYLKKSIILYYFKLSHPFQGVDRCGAPV